MALALPGWIDEWSANQRLIPTHRSRSEALAFSEIEMIEWPALAITLVYFLGFAYCLYSARNRPSNWPHDLGYAAGAIFFSASNAATLHKFAK